MNKKKLLGKRIKEIRKARGLTQEKLAELIDIETCSLSAIEIGRHFPSMPTIVKISEQLGVELKSLFIFGHIKTKKEKIELIKNRLDDLSDTKIDFIYKFIEF